MLGVGDKLPDFSVVGVKPKFNAHEENGESAFEDIAQDSFSGKWKVIYFYPKDFTFVCPTEIAEFGRLKVDVVKTDERRHAVEQMLATNREAGHAGERDFDD